MNWQKRTQPVKVGDTVAYSKAFLQSVARLHRRPATVHHGNVTALISVGKDVTLAEINWNLPDLPGRVNVKNLCLASQIAFEL